MDEKTETVKFELVRPRFFTPKVVSSLVSVPIGAFFGTLYHFYRLHKSGTDVLPETVLLSASLMCAFFIAVILVYRLITQPKTSPCIELKQNHISLPKSYSSIKTIDVEYQNVRSIGLRGLMRLKRLIVDTNRRLFVFPVKKFIQADAPQVIRSEFRTRIEGLDGGSELIAAMNRREEVGAAFLSRKIYATWALFFLIVSIFVVQVLLVVSRGPMAYIGLGANSSILVFDGQCYRLISANFLHGGFLHLFMNGVALLFLGALVERMVGWQRFLTIYILSAIGGSLASALMQRATFSVGASTALFGLLGALLVLHIMYWSVLPAGFRQTIKWWVIIILLNGLLPVLAPQIDIAAHAGGFAVGAVSTWLLCSSDKILRAGEKPSRYILITTALTSIACLAGLSVAAVNAVEPSKSDELKFIDEFISNVDVSEYALNDMAWSIAIDPDASKEHLEVARKASEKAVELAPDNHVANNLDTLATIYYRLGLLDDAVLMQLKALQGEIEERHKKALYSQMARFLRARNDRDGVMLVGDVKPEDVTITWNPKDESTKRPRIRLEFDEKLKVGATILVHVMHKDWPIGLMMGRWASKKKPRTSRSPDFAKGWPEDAKLEIGLIKKGKAFLMLNVSKLTYFDLDPEVMERP